MDYIREIAEALSNDHAAVMIGAGFSKNADKISSIDKWFKNWNELSDVFYDTVYGSKDDGPGKEYNSSLRLAQEVEITVGRPKLEKILKEAIPDEDYAPSEVYTKLMELPWRDVFTTNYDTLLERAADKVSKRRYNVVVNQEDLVNSNDAPRILKLHGSFPSQRPFIITEEDYRTYPVKFAAMVNTVQQALLENVFCMIGFSCEDPNFLSWIGWIHDNLGKSSSQKIYMISVSHISEAKQKLLFDKNIIVVDLQTLCPEKEIPKRLLWFFDRLNELTEEKKKKNQWFDFAETSISEKETFEERTKKLKKLNNSYPGWIFLPWKIKHKVNRILQSLEEDYYFSSQEKFEDILPTVQLDYMYEYVKFLNIVGRPILLQTVEQFWDALEKIKSEYKTQFIYLQLLRAFRELADWERYDLCRGKIQESILNYEEKQFLYACDWWMMLYRFEDKNLVEMLNQWDLTQGDLYWPMIKSSMYAIVGDAVKGEQILSEILPQIRKQLVKNSRDEYLCSLEESVVSLLNFIRQGNWNENREDCIQTGDVSWWKENDKYCSHLNEKEKEESSFKVQTNYDLSVTYTTHWGRDNTKVYYALEYLRFLEQTGHPFRLQQVTNTKGFENTIKTLYLYYPHWCFMQMLIAQDEKQLDILFGRNKLAGMTQEEVDACVQEYLDALELVSKNVKPENAFWAKSVYEHSAQILPQIISRLCYKCSLEMLDQILEYMLTLCCSNVRDNFKGINKILEGVCHAYTQKEQGERIEKILQFPMLTNQRRDYRDPVNYLTRPDEKYKISSNFYNNIMLQIRQLICNGSPEEKEDALQRLIILAQLVSLEEQDEEFLYQQMEAKEGYEYRSILYHINKERYVQNITAILDGTLQLMKSDSNEERFASHTQSYADLFEVLPDLSPETVDYANAFSVMTDLIRTNGHWKKSEHASLHADERSRQSYIIAIGLLLLKLRGQKDSLSRKEQKAIDEYFKTLQEYYPKSFVPEFIGKILVESAICSLDMANEKTNVCNEMEQRLWICSEDDIMLLRHFYLTCYRMKYDIKNSDRLYYFSNLLYKMAVYKIINIEINNIMPALQLLYSLVINGINAKRENNRFFISLPRLMKETTIQLEDSEEKARHKINCRMQICIIAREFYKSGEHDKNVLQWKKLTENPEEFVEIRNIDFE